MRRCPPRGISRDGRRVCPGLGERPFEVGAGTANVAAEAYENAGACWLVLPAVRKAPVELPELSGSIFSCMNKLSESIILNGRFLRS